MRITVAIPMLEKSIPHLPATLNSLHAQGVDEVMLLWLEKMNSVNAQGDVRSARVHPDFIVEAAMHEASCDWIFVIYPGEHFEHGDLKSKVSKHSDATWISLGGQIRGFRRNAVSNGGVVRIDSPVLAGTGLKPAVQWEPLPEPVLPLTVILPTWRLGGLDVTLSALAKQVETPSCAMDECEFEVVIVDALYRWRAGEIRRQCEKFVFPVTHVDVDDSIFPVSCHSRFRNTAIRRAKGKRVIFLSDYAVPPPDFIAKHAALPDDTIGLAPWARTTLNTDAIVCALNLSVFDVMARASQGAYLWSTLKSNVDPFGPVIARFPTNPQANVELGTQEYLAHYKADSVPLELCRRINGWDESFDGRGDCADVDFSLRLLWAGAKMRVLDIEVPVLDAHVISVAPLSDWTRSNRNRLVDTRIKRMVRCVFGLERGIIND